MKFKVSHLVGAVLLCSTVYAGQVVVENKLRDIGFDSQVEPSFYQRQLIEDLLLTSDMELPKGKFDYTYHYKANSVIKTIWFFDGTKLVVDGFLVNNSYTDITSKDPYYTARADVAFQGSVLQFTNASGSIGLLPKYGLAVKELNLNKIQLATSDGSEAYMYKMRASNER
ncbi:hypothetical protein OH460_07455 [Vibrio sp. Makdt]|uniref:hypothetical protein n=1 Tax=Vibrio sp. Makdt TaxID=2998828 RepID=UPI0022CDA561|nr:hypothetical protein [Vibrio sp. Makdt]MDA0152133.1 hypothetical protein [Vibrio sp. Makdt]